MSQSANVRSVGAIHDFKIALTNFAEDARNALGSAEMDLRRTRDWLTRDQLTYWQAQVKRCQEQVSMARADLFRRKISQQGSDAVSDADQKEALRAAIRRQQEAEEKVARIKRWIPVLDHAISEYHSTSQPLGDRLSGSLVNSLTLLERTIGSLEAYINVAPPSAPVLPPETGAGAPASAASGTATAPAAAAVEAPAETPARPEDDGPAAGNPASRRTDGEDPS